MASAPRLSPQGDVKESRFSPPMSSELSLWVSVGNLGKLMYRRREYLPRQLQPCLQGLVLRYLDRIVVRLSRREK